MIGGLAKSATSVLRQLVDAGTLSNLPGGLKSRGLRIRGEDSPISPGEFRDVDVPGGAIRDNITFLPYKEPSAVLYQLLGNIVEEGRRFASLTDLKISDMSNQAPVGTTLALLERSMKVMAAIQARLHNSMKGEFRILESIVKENTPTEYPYDLDGDETMKQEDFDDRIDILPVSDPNSSTMAQRIMQYQAALQLAETNPQIYDLPVLHRQMLEVLGIKEADKVVPAEDDIPVRDPVSENMDIITGSPVKSYIWQDHEAHIATHMAAAEDPSILQLMEKDPNAQAKQSALMAHVSEHAAFQYRVQIQEQMGVDMPPPDEELTDDVEVSLSRIVSQAADRLLAERKGEAAQKEKEEQAEDPVLQMRREEIEIKKMEVQAKVSDQQARLALDQQKAQDKSAIDKERIESGERVAEGNAGIDIVKTLVNAKAKDGELSAEEARASAEMGLRLSELMLSAEKMMRVEKAEGAKIGTKIMEKLMDLDRDIAKNRGGNGPSS